MTGSGSWARTTSASGYGSGTASALAPFYSISGTTPFELISPEFNAAGAVVSFDHAYATYVDEVDQLIILYSIDGGQNYNSLVTLAGGLTGPLNTGGATEDPFVPTSAQWASKSYALPAGTNKVKFQAISAYGNNLFLDNIFIGEPPSIDLRFSQFYQSSGLPVPMNAGATSGGISKVKREGMYNQRRDLYQELPGGLPGIPETQENHSKIVTGSNRSVTEVTLADIAVTAEIENIGTDPASYTLEWDVAGIDQTGYAGGPVNPGFTEVVSLTYPSPPERGTFFANGSITLPDDGNPGNNNNSFRLRVYPDNYTRTIYDRGDNNVDTYVGWNDPSTPMRAGVRYAAADYIKPAGVDFICRTETVTTGTYNIEVRGAGTDNQAPGAVLYTATYTDPVFFSEGGDYLHFAFDEMLVPTFAPGSDYWITIECPLGVLYPGAAQTDDVEPIIPGHSFYYIPSTTSWTPLVLSAVEYAWIMRSVEIAGEIPECPAPTLPTVTGISSTGASLGWTGMPDSFFDIFLEVAGGPPPDETTVPVIDDTQVNPFPWNGGLPGTEYEWWVRQDCGQDNTDVSTWTPGIPFQTLLCEIADQCTYTVLEEDSYGDGWNGTVLGFRQNGVIVATFGEGFVDGFSFGPEDAGLCDAMTTEIVVVVLGSYTTEVGFSVFDPFNEEIFTWEPGTAFDETTIFHTFTSDCTPPTCPPPENLYTDNITFESASLNFDLPGGDWQIDSFFDIFYAIEGNEPGDPGTTISNVTTSPVEIGGLD
ncbi:MAG: hypothetical protein KBC43_06010 [Bacteroidales bacterium]|nr:hypothetical protein [Bacteroidales bacterium]